MTSILTNQGAMVALQTLKGINSNLGNVQEQISTGKKVGTASDNAAVWAISKTMEADVTGFKKIEEGLAAGKSTVAVARDASETVTDLLTQMKDKIVQAQGEGVDASSKEKIQADINALTKQISSVVSGAQFNGRNLVDGTTPSPMNVLSSLDRDIDGNVTAANIEVRTGDLRIGDVIDANTVAKDTVADGASIGAALTAMQGGAGALTVSDAAADQDDYTGLLAGDQIVIEAGNQKLTYTIGEGEDSAAIDANVAAALTDAGITDVTYAGGQLTNASGGDLEMGITVQRGGLAALADLDVTGEADANGVTGAQKAMAAIEGLLQTSIDAAASFGTSENQLETQSEFVSKLSDTLKAGIGSMVDANMEEASAKLKALQTQQQLGIQSLSIANQAPGAIMSLFR